MENKLDNIILLLKSIENRIVKIEDRILTIERRTYFEPLHLDFPPHNPHNPVIHRVTCHNPLNPMNKIFPDFK